MSDRDDFEAAVRALIEADPHNNKKAAELEAWFDDKGVPATGSTLVSDSAMKQVGNRIQERATHRKPVVVFAYRDDAVGDRLKECLVARLLDPDDLYAEFEAAILVKASGKTIEAKTMVRVRPNAVTELITTAYPDLTVEEVTRGPAGGGDGNGTDPLFTDDDLSTDAFIPLEELKRIVSLLRRRRNVILQGPPGVGKSFLAKRIAYSAIGQKVPARVLSLQFHPNYSYEEFVEGYRPKEDESGFEVVAGNLRDFVENVVLDCDDDELCVLILDEINRANLSSVLGEVMSLIESDKRGDRHAIQMVYSRTSFFLPENLLVLGLMNTADRSIALVDYALRRRFAFVDLPPRFNAEFKTYLQARAIPEAIIDQLFTGIEEVNAAIRASATSLGRGFEIGHSYFCKCPDLSGTAEPERAAAASAWLEEVLEHDIAPLLREYWFDDRDMRATMIRTLLGREPTEAESRTMVD